MLREEQIDLRRQRAVAEQLRIQNLGRNRVFSDYQVSNPKTGGQYRVSIRGFDVGDNSCDCPDFKTNTLGTCKHIEAVLASLKDEALPQLRRRKAAITNPEVYLQYGEQLRVGLHLPPRHSDGLAALAAQFFDPRGHWTAGDRYDLFIDAVDKVPEHVTILSDAMEFMEREIERRDMARREAELLARIERGESDPAIENLLAVPLYPYQLRGALFAACRGRCILGDDMGLGKTVQTLAAAEFLARERGIERVLVVAPASVKYQWASEIQKYTQRMVQIVDGSTAQRRTLYGQPTFYRLVNYEVALRDLDELNAWHADLIVLDEAQRIKNWESKTTRAIKKLRSRYALVLTGTPLENKLEELYSIVQFVDDRRLGPAFQFLHDHRRLDAKGNLVGYRNLDRIREKLEPILLRRTREEVLSQLPARTDNTVYVEMAEAQRGPYQEQQTTLARLLQKKYLTEVDRRRILSCVTNLRMLCDSTFLLDKTTNVSPKQDELTELLGQLIGAGPHKVVVFSQWETMLQKAAEVVKRLGVGHVVLHGSVPGKDRRALIERFRDDETCRVFLSTDAGGTGLNLQSADTVINLEVPWNPAVLEQRIARVHRMGQHRPVQVFNLVTRDSIEERVLRTLERKRTLFAGVFTDPSDEVLFTTLGHQAFLDTMRQLVEEEALPLPTEVDGEGEAHREGEAPAEPAVPGSAGASPSPRAAPSGQLSLARAAVQFLEALAAVGVPSLVTTDATGRPVLQMPLPPAEVLQRGTAALRAILGRMGETNGSATTDSDNVK
jgi:superfamily II DNA or RNA helicase